MKARAPKHWDKKGLIPTLLTPAAFFYARGTASRLKKPGYRPKAKVICVGNIVAGGAGKTPSAIAIAKLLQAEGKNVHFISTGFGRKNESSAVIKVKSQSAEEVGDEPLLLAQTAPTWVASSRAEAAKEADNAGADVIIMDDGFQNPDVEKDVSLLVIDGAYGFGNEKVIPAGPLREPVATALKRASAIIVTGKLNIELPKADLPVFKTNQEIFVPETVFEEKVVAFCGLGRPEKFFESLKAKKLDVVEELAFPDHHPYNEADFKAVFGIANSHQAVVVTTEKDLVKVPERFKKMIYPVELELTFQAEKKFTKFITDKLK